MDDASQDGTAQLASLSPGILVHRHDRNRGYGGDQKTCYRLAADQGADIVIMVHPDYQYTPKLLPAMAALIGNDLYHCVLGSSILRGYELQGGMPTWRYVSDHLLTLAKNLFNGTKLSEYHAGYRACSRSPLKRLPIAGNADDFVVDNQMRRQVLWFGYAIAERSGATGYFPDASNMNLRRSVRYGIGRLITSVEFILARWGVRYSDRFPSFT